MEETLSQEEYIYWLGYYMEEGFPQDREDLRVATLCSVITNMSGKSLKKNKSMSPKDFMPEKWKSNQSIHKTKEQQRKEAEAFLKNYQEVTSGSKRSSKSNRKTNS
jgi:hypothetical protein